MRPVLGSPLGSSVDPRPTQPYPRREDLSSKACEILREMEETAKLPYGERPDPFEATKKWANDFEDYFAAMKVRSFEIDLMIERERRKPVERAFIVQAPTVFYRSVAARMDLIKPDHVPLLCLSA